jgi:hypothetical protein
MGFQLQFLFGEPVEELASTQVELPDPMPPIPHYLEVQERP